MKQKYQLQILTPVHIGTGETLNHIDGYYANGRWYHIDLEQVLAHPTTDINALTADMGRRDFRWERYFRQHNMDPAEVSVYSLSCLQNPETGDIREAIQTVDKRPYIPGSTLKGAIRTALLGEILCESDPVYETSLDHLKTLIDQTPRGNPRREQPARRIENTAFGKDPNHDLFRALQVSDTTPLDNDALEIGLAWTVTLNPNDQLAEKIDNGREYKNFVQHIKARQRLTFTLKIDDLLFREREKKRLRFNDLQEERLKDIAEVCRSAAAQLMDRELDFFDYYNFPNIPDVYDKLIDSNKDLPEGAFFLQIGWGTGYHAHTITSLFADDEESPENLWMDVRKRFRLGESRSRRGNYDDREFPKTRRILYRGQNPVVPLGWVKITPLEKS